MARQRRFWARPPGLNEKGEPGMSYDPGFQRSYLRMADENEEFYKDKLQDMEASSELVWVEERGDFGKAGPWRRKSSDAKGDDFAGTTETTTKPNQVTVSTSTTNPPGSSSSLARSKADASTSSVSSQSDQVAGEGEKPRERLKKNLQKLKIRSRLKSAHKSKPREGELRSSDEDLTGFSETSSAKACDDDAEAEAEEYSDSFESFESEDDEGGDDDALSLLGSGSDVCRYDFDTLEEDKVASGDELSSPVLGDGPRSPLDELSTPLASEKSLETFLGYPESPPKPEDLRYDDLIEEYFCSRTSLDAENENEVGGKEAKTKGGHPGEQDNKRRPLNALNALCNTKPISSEDQDYHRAEENRETKESPKEIARGVDIERNIPVLPCGLVLTVVIHSNWGDKDCVGLNGIEIFDEDGYLVNFTSPKTQISLENDRSDDGPSTDSALERLTDGNHLTCDASHIWSTLFGQGEKPKISFNFPDQTSIGAVRIWNYNKSRIHSHRGAREVELILDDTCIFTERSRRLRASPARPGRVQRPFSSQPTRTPSRTLTYLTPSTPLSSKPHKWSWSGRPTLLSCHR